MVSIMDFTYVIFCISISIIDKNIKNPYTNNRFINLYKMILLGLFFYTYVCVVIMIKYDQR